MLKGTIFVGYQKRNFLLCAKLPNSSNFPSRQNCVSMQRNDDEITIHRRSFIIAVFIKSKKEGKVLKLLQWGTTPDQGHHMGKQQNTIKHHTQESQEISLFPAGDHNTINSIRTNAVYRLHRCICSSETLLFAYCKQASVMLTYRACKRINTWLNAVYKYTWTQQVALVNALDL